MKKIFVTVKEFEANGGVLKKGRQVFEEEEEAADGIFECQHGDDNIICYFGGVADKIQKDYCYVQIDCTPIYL